MRAPRPPLPLVLGFAAFLAVIVLVVAASLVRPAPVAEFAPTPPGVRPSGGRGPDTVTIDAGDPRHWRFYSFRRGVLSAPDTADWDLGFRRHHVIASGAAADLGHRAESSASRDSVAFQETVFARDTVNPALARWYRYSVITHLLRPNDHLFLVRTREGALVRLELLGYYCPGSRPGCPTFRWAWARP